MHVFFIDEALDKQQFLFLAEQSGLLLDQIPLSHGRLKRISFLLGLSDDFNHCHQLICHCLLCMAISSGFPLALLPAQQTCKNNCSCNNVGKVKKMPLT